MLIYSGPWIFSIFFFFSWLYNHFFSFLYLAVKLKPNFCFWIFMSYRQKPTFNWHKSSTKLLHGVQCCYNYIPPTQHYYTNIKLFPNYWYYLYCTNCPKFIICLYFRKIQWAFILPESIQTVKFRALSLFVMLSPPKIFDWQVLYSQG